MSRAVLVIGELNVDLIITGLAGLPQLGQELTCAGYTRALGSSSAIFARVLAGLGAAVDFMGKVGDDDNGRFMLDQLRELRIGTQGVIVDRQVQTGVTISLTYPQEKAQITYPGSIAGLTLAELDLANLGRYVHLHLATMYLQTGLRPDFPALLRQAQAAGLTTSLDPGWDPTGRWEPDLQAVLAAVDVLFVNEHEVRAITGAMDPAAGARILAQSVPLVVAKLGPRGVLLARGEELLRVLALPVSVVDTTGAGDSCDAGFIYRHIVQSRPAEEALAFANACGALAVTRVGGASLTPTAELVDAFLASCNREQVSRS
jgi:sugar/nucleoside kinase (ribokinase family)